MKFHLPLLALLCTIPATSHAENINFLEKNPGFGKQYMQCEAALKEASGKDEASIPCPVKVSLTYCKTFESTPPDIQGKLEMDLACNFLAGEFRGDNSQYDKNIAEDVQKLGCLANDTKTIELLRTYWGKEAESRALLFFVKEYMDAENSCYNKGT